MSSLSLLSKVQPLSHEEITLFRSNEAGVILAEKSSCLTDYDAVAILSLASKWKISGARHEYTNEYLSRLVQGVVLGYGFKNGVQSSLKPSTTDRIIFQDSLENAGEQLLNTSDLPTGAAVWSGAGENHSAHAVQIAEWLKVRRAGALDMEYLVPPTRHPDAVLPVVFVAGAGWGVVEGALRSDNLVIHDWLGSGTKRLTNVPIRQGFYDDEFFQVTNCHPYQPTDVLSVKEAKAMEQPIVVEYDYNTYKGAVPQAIKTIVGILVPRLYLNVQDNPWNGNQILLRPHAMRWMFPSDNYNYAAKAYAVDDVGMVLLNETSSVHIHDKVASPISMPLKSIDHKKEMAFYSVVVYDGKAAITRHVFLTPEQREQLQQVFMPDAKAYKAEEFQEFLTPDWRDFLVRMGIPLA